MRKRLILNDIRKNRLFTAATVAFMTVSAMLFALTVLLSVSLLSSIQTLMEQAETPDFLQMHAGTVKEEEISAFAVAVDDTCKRLHSSVFHHPLTYFKSVRHYAYSICRNRDRR